MHFLEGRSTKRRCITVILSSLLVFFLVGLESDNVYAGRKEASEKSKAQSDSHKKTFSRQRGSRTEQRTATKETSEQSSSENKQGGKPRYALRSMEGASDEEVLKQAEGERIKENEYIEGTATINLGEAQVTVKLPAKHLKDAWNQRTATTELLLRQSGRQEGKTYSTELDTSGLLTSEYFDEKLNELDNKWEENKQSDYDEKVLESIIGKTATELEQKFNEAPIVAQVDDDTLGKLVETTADGIRAANKERPNVVQMNDDDVRRIVNEAVNESEKRNKAQIKSFEDKLSSNRSSITQDRIRRLRAELNVFPDESDEEAMNEDVEEVYDRASKTKKNKSKRGISTRARGDKTVSFGGEDQLEDEHVVKSGLFSEVTQRIFRDLGISDSNVYHYRGESLVISGSVINFQDKRLSFLNAMLTRISQAGVIERFSTRLLPRLEEELYFAEQIYHHYREDLGIVGQQRAAVYSKEDVLGFIVLLNLLVKENIFVDGQLVTYLLAKQSDDRLSEEGHFIVALMHALIMPGEFSNFGQQKSVLITRNFQERKMGIGGVNQQKVQSELVDEDKENEDQEEEVQGSISVKPVYLKIFDYKKGTEKFIRLDQNWRTKYWMCYWYMGRSVSQLASDYVFTRKTAVAFGVLALMYAAKEGYVMAATYKTLALLKGLNATK